MRPLRTKVAAMVAGASFLSFVPFVPASTSAASPSGAATVNLTIETEWPLIDLPAFPTIIKQFEQLHPNVHIVWTATASGNAGIADLDAKFLAGDPADIVQAFKQDFNSFQVAGYLTNLTSWEKSAGIYNSFVPGSQSYSSPLSQATNPHPQVYGVGDVMDVSAFFYNVGLFKKYGLQPPSTLAQLESVGKVFLSHGIAPIAITAGANDNNDTDILAKAVDQFAGAGELLKVNNGTAKWTDPPMMAAAKAVGTLVSLGLIGKNSAGADEEGCATLVAEGRAAMCSMHTGLLPNFFALEKADPSFKVGVITGLKFTNNPVSLNAVTYGGTWGIPKADNSTIMPVAEAFLQYLTSPKPAALLANSVGAASDTLAADSHLNNALAESVFKNLEPTLTPQGLYMVDFIAPQVADALGLAMRQLVQGEITYQTMMQHAQAAQAKVLAQKS